MISGPGLAQGYGGLHVFQVLHPNRRFFGMYQKTKNAQRGYTAGQLLLTVFTISMVMSLSLGGLDISSAQEDAMRARGNYFAKPSAPFLIQERTHAGAARKSGQQLLRLTTGVEPPAGDPDNTLDELFMARILEEQRLDRPVQVAWGPDIAVTTGNGS